MIEWPYNNSRSWTWLVTPVVICCYFAFCDWFATRVIPITAPKRTFSSYYYHVCRYKRDSRRLGDRGIQFERSLVSCRKMNGLIIPEGRDWRIWRNATVTLSSRCHASRIHLFPVILVLCHRQQNSSSNTQCSFDGHMAGYPPPLFVGLQVNTEKKLM